MEVILLRPKLLMWLAHLQILTLEQKFRSESTMKLLISFKENTSVHKFSRLLYKSLVQGKLKLPEIYKPRHISTISFLEIKEMKCTVNMK